MKELLGNPSRQQLMIKDSAALDSGAIILGTHGVFQHSDLGKYVYDQDGGNTCQSYTLLGQMVQGNMSTATVSAYNNILTKFGLKATIIMDKESIKTTLDKRNAIKEQLRKGKIVNSGMYLDAPPAEPKYNNKNEKIEPHKGHRVNIVGYDDVEEEWIVNDSNQKGELTRYPYGDFELGNRWSAVLEKK